MIITEDIDSERFQHHKHYDSLKLMQSKITDILKKSSIFNKVQWTHKSSDGDWDINLWISEEGLEKILNKCNTPISVSESGCYTFPYAEDAGKLITATYTLSRDETPKFLILIPMNVPYPVLFFISLRLGSFQMLQSSSTPRRFRMQKYSFFNGDFGYQEFTTLIRSTSLDFEEGIGREKNRLYVRNKGEWCIAHRLKNAYYHVWDSASEFLNWFNESPLEVKS